LRGEKLGISFWGSLSWLDGETILTGGNGPGRFSSQRGEGERGVCGGDGRFFSSPLFFFSLRDEALSSLRHSRELSFIRVVLAQRTKRMTRHHTRKEGGVRVLFFLLPMLLEMGRVLGYIRSVSFCPLKNRPSDLHPKRATGRSPFNTPGLHRQSTNFFPIPVSLHHLGISKLIARFLANFIVMASCRNLNLPAENGEFDQHMCYKKRDSPTIIRGRDAFPSGSEKSGQDRE